MNKAIRWVLAFVLLAGMLPHMALPVNATVGANTYTLNYSIGTADPPVGNMPQPPARPLPCDEVFTLPATAPTNQYKTFTHWRDESNNIDYDERNPQVLAWTYTNGQAVTLTAQWDDKEYTIIYNANGGSWLHGLPSPQTKQAGEPAYLPSNYMPVRSGYMFQGWATSATAKTEEYEPGDPYTTDADVTLYAVWGREQPNYTITFNANGGIGAPPAQLKEHGESLTLSDTEPTRSGYDFLGWATSASSSIVEYPSGGDIPANRNVNIALYAVWIPDGVPRYTITYNANGGNGAPNSQTKVHDEALTLSSTQPTRSGYTFLGWETSASATTAQFQAGGTIAANMNEDMTLYAVWERGSSSGGNNNNNGSEGDTYSIVYHANGGRGAPDQQTKAHGETLTLSNRQPTRSGYYFDGWAYNRGDTEAYFWPGDLYRYNESAVLYAVWRSESGGSWSRYEDEYIVFFDANGGGGAPAPQYKRHDVSLVLSGSRPTRPGYTFIGWSANSTAATAHYQPGSRYAENADITLYAVWATGLPQTGRQFPPLPWLAAFGISLFLVGRIVWRKKIK